MPSPVSRSRPPDEASRLRRIRRYAVPRWMIEQATERRLAGDWRGACAAAGVGVNIGLADVADRHGSEVASTLEDDLLHLAPDLVRWHLPRVGPGRTTIVPSQHMVLGGPGGGGPRLYLSTPRWSAHGPQRLELHFGPVPDGDVFLETDWAYSAFWRNVVQNWTGSRHLWDARHAGELRERSGGDARRAPFLHPGGTLRAADELPAADPGTADPAARTEWITTLHEGGAVEAALAAAGIEADIATVELPWAKESTAEPLQVFERMPLDLARLEPEVRRLTAATGAERTWIPHTQHTALLLDPIGERGLRIRLIPHGSGDEPERALVLPDSSWRRLPDLDLLRDGRTPPGWLHPLVQESLLPDRPPATGPAGPPGPEPPYAVRVRCRGEWHEVVCRDGALRVPHDRAEQDRESALRAFGGASAGCFAVQQAWTAGTGRLPRALLAQRDELFARAQHGDTPGVLRMLDSGIDPHVRNARGRTLLHVLNLLDHEALLPRLLTAGLDVEAADEQRRTPLFVAVCDEGPTSLVRALLDAGARIDVMGEIHDEPLSLHRLIDLQQRTDLEFVQDRIECEHPGLLEDDE